jgi:SAM-dependent methyltransferase
MGDAPAKVQALDLSCGRGDVLFEVVQKLTPDSRVVAINDSRDQLNHLHERLKLKEQPRVIYPRLEHPERLPFADNVFDRVWAGLVSSTLEPVRPSLRTALRVLRPGGQVVVAAVARDTLITFMRMVGKYLTSAKDDSMRARPLVLDHARALDKIGWEEAMRRSGASEVSAVVHQFDWLLTVPLAEDPIMLDCFAPFGLAPETDAGKEQLQLLNQMVTDPVSLPISIVVVSGKKAA